MEILKGLLQVKVIIAIIMTVVFCYLTITGKIEAQNFVTIFSSVLAFFFGQTYSRQTNNGTNSETDDLLRSASDEVNKEDDLLKDDNNEELKKDITEEVGS